MAVTRRDLPTLKLLARYGVMSTRQIQRLCYPTDVSGRITRRRLQILSRDDYVRKSALEVVNPKRGGSTPLWHLGNQGREELSIELADDRLLLKPINPPKPLHPYHAILLTDFYAMVDAAIAVQDHVVIEASFHEHEFVNINEPDPKKHFRLFTEIQAKDPRITCSPDMALVLRVDEYVGAFYVEMESGTNGPRFAASNKFRGYAALAKRELHRERHFPSVTLKSPRVLSIWPTPKKRDAFLRQMRNKDAAVLWSAAADTDLSAETLLHGPVWYRVGSDKPSPLVKPSSENT